MDETFLYLKDDRTEKMKELSINITRGLTSLNLKRIQSLQYTSKIPQGDKYNRKNYLYVCFSGIPPRKEEFDDLGIQGEKIVFVPEGIWPDITEEEALSRVQYAPIDKQVANIHEKLQHRKDKPMVFIYHSFGTTLLATLFRLYSGYYVSRTIGIIALGPYPIRFTPLLADDVRIGYNKTIEDLKENLDENYGNYLKFVERFRLRYAQNKYSYLCRNVMFTQGLGFAEMFAYIRQLPPVLKCIIYGRKDMYFDESLLSQVAIFYSYKRKFDPQYEAQIRKVLKEQNGKDIENVQQRFIYNIAEGKHSPHWQKSLFPLLFKIIDQYLSTIEQIYYRKPA